MQFHIKADAQDLACSTYFAHLILSGCKSARCCWMGRRAASWTDSHFPDTGTCFPRTAVQTMYWRQWGASRSGCHVLIALRSTRRHTRTHRDTHRHTFHAFIDGQKKAADGSGLAPPLYQHKPNFFQPISHCTSHPSQARPATQNNTPLSSFPNPNSRGRSNPSFPNQVRRTCPLWLQPYGSHQLLPWTLSFTLLLPTLAQHCVTFIYHLLLFLFYLTI